MPAKAKIKAGGIWKDATVEREWPDGYKVVRVRTQADLTTLSDNGGGCSKAHTFWTHHARPISEYFFVMQKPDGGVGPILFCKDMRWFGKNHPQEDLYQREWYKKIDAIARYGSPIGSAYYDHRYNSPEDMAREYGRYGANDVQGRLDDAVYQQTRIRQRAMAAGPLGKDNPYKAELDQANRHVNACKDAVTKAEKSKRVQAGLVFKYGTKELFIIQVAGRGTSYYDGTDDVYTPKFMEFTGVGKEA